MKSLSKKLIQELLAVDEAPCISLYMPTHRSHPENLQDPIRFKNLLKEIEESLHKKYSKEETRDFLAPLEDISTDKDIWNYTLDGLAIFSSESHFEVVKLPIELEELALVADSFHTKPLRKYLQSADRYYVLGLNLHEIKLYEGYRHSLAEVDLNHGIPETIEEAVGEELTDGHLTAASYGGVSGESSSMFHGHGSRKEETNVDAVKFFRAIGDAITEKVSKPTGLPLILAALPEHHHLFQELNKNPYLLPEGIPINHKGVPIEKLKTMAWEVMEPIYHEKLQKYAEEFGEAKAHGKGSDDLKEVAVAAVEGKIERLLVEADKIIAMRITNLTTGNMQNKDIDNPRIDDLLDDMGELVLKLGGDVVVVPADKMPSETGLAAIYRY
ncbi:MAG: hypothetical protein ACFCUU_10345 [Cyclobacteriaceae bacterium]